jgi:hypothetical protein
MRWRRGAAAVFVVLTGALIVWLWWVEEPTFRARLTARELTLGGLDKPTGAHAGTPAPATRSFDIDAELLAGTVGLQLNDADIPWTPAEGAGVHRHFSLELPVSEGCGALELIASDENGGGTRLTIGRSPPTDASASCGWALVTPSSDPARRPLAPNDQLALIYKSSATGDSARVLSRLNLRSVSSPQLTEDVHPFDVGEERSGDACLGDSIRLKAERLWLGRIDLRPSNGERRHPVLIAQTYTKSYDEVTSLTPGIGRSCLSRHMQRRFLRLGALTSATISLSLVLLGLFKRKQPCRGSAEGSE